MAQRSFAQMYRKKTNGLDIDNAYELSANASRASTHMCANGPWDQGTHNPHEYPASSSAGFGPSVASFP
jgi:hypothetical protein